MNIALIGAGIAGELTAFLLLRAGHEVTLYDPGHVRGPASWNSTGVVGSFGTRRGYGLLGDLLVDALPVARKFYEDFNHPSVLEASLHYLSYNGDENFHRRFQHLPKGLSLEGQDIDTGLPKVSQQVFREQGQLIDCQGFMGELRRRNNQSPLCMRVQRYITSREQVSGHSLILYAPGAIRSLLPLDEVQTRPWQGTFLLWEGEFYPRTFHYDFYQKGVISYRKEQGKLLLAAVNQGTMTGLAEVSTIHQFYRQMQDLSGISLPSFEQARICSGIRERAVKHLPQLTPMGKNFYSLSGLYKNGYTLAPFFARQFLREVNRF